MIKCWNVNLISPRFAILISIKLCPTHTINWTIMWFALTQKTIIERTATCQNSHSKFKVQCKFYHKPLWIFPVTHIKMKIESFIQYLNKMQSLSKCCHIISSENENDRLKQIKSVCLTPRLSANKGRRVTYPPGHWQRWSQFRDVPTVYVNASKWEGHQQCNGHQRRIENCCWTIGFKSLLDRCDLWR